MLMMLNDHLSMARTQQVRFDWTTTSNRLKTLSSEAEGMLLLSGIQDSTFIRIVSQLK